MRGLLAAVALLAASSCASPRPAEVRELARERYEIRDRGALVATGELVLGTKRDYGKHVAYEERSEGSGATGRVELDLAPDWSVRAARVHDAAGALAELSLDRDQSHVRGTHAADLSRAGALLAGDPATLLSLVRRLDLAAGDRIEIPSFDLGADGAPQQGLLVVDRTPDRGDRECYLLRRGAEEWLELETDRRGLALVIRGGERVVERVP